MTSRRSGWLSGVRVSASFRQALRPEAPADFLLSATTLPAGSRCRPLDLTPVGSSLPPRGGGGGGEGPRERRGNPQGAAGPSCVPALFPAQPGRVVWSLICRVWRRTSARTSEVPHQPAPGCGQVPEQPRSGREASLGKPPVPLEEALSCRAVPHLQQPARRGPRSSLGIEVGRWRGPPPSLQSGGSC